MFQISPAMVVVLEINVLAQNSSSSVSIPCHSPSRMSVSSLPSLPTSSNRKIPLRSPQVARGSSASSKMPSLIRSSGLGRACSFCSRLSLRMCFCSSLAWPCSAGAAAESGRMLPVVEKQNPRQILHRLESQGELEEEEEKGRTLHELLPVRPLLEPLLQAVRRTITLQLLGGALEGSVATMHQQQVSAREKRDSKSQVKKRSPTRDQGLETKGYNSRGRR